MSPPSVSIVIAREVSDGVIAPDYEPAAIDFLRAKKGGKYAVIQIDPTYEPDLTENRDVFGITFEQRRHEGLVDLGWTLLVSGDTAQRLRENDLNVTEVADYTKSPEILDGRVKTLHPAIHGG